MDCLVAGPHPVVGLAANVGIACHGDDGHVGYETDARKRFTAETQGGDCFQVLELPQLRCGMAMAQNRQVVFLLYKTSARTIKL
jgi:hypothetical protein